MYCLSPHTHKLEIFFFQLKKKKSNFVALKSIQHFMTGTATVLSQNFDYYTCYVMCNCVFEEPEPVIQNGYTYEENGVLYCTSATQKGVYCYTYARNNPLMYTDPEGELAWFIPLIAIGISALVSATSYTIQVATSPGGFQNWSWEDFAGNVMMGVGMGLITSGIGGAFGAVGSLGVLGEIGRAGAHAVVGGMFSYANDGSFWAGAATGFASSLIGSATHNLPSLAQIGISTITGGVTSAISGGTFWQGAVNGFLVSALNHAAHDIPQELEKRKIYNTLKEKYESGKLQANVKNGGFATALGTTTFGKSADLTLKELAEIANMASEADMTKILKGISKGGKIIGFAGGLASAGVAFDELMKNPTWGNGAAFAVQAIAAGAVWIPGWGWAVSLGLTVADFYWGDKLYNLIDGQ